MGAAENANLHNDQAHLDNFVYLHGGDMLAC